MLPQGNEGLTPKQISQRKYREANKEKLKAKAEVYREITGTSYDAAKRRYNQSARGKELKRTNLRASRYGLTRSELAELVSKPCAICGNPSEHIDHCHSSGKVRAALCGYCNKGLGMFKDNPEILRNAANYLERFNMQEEIQPASEPQPSEQPAWVQLELPFEDFPLGQACGMQDGPCESCQ